LGSENDELIGQDTNKRYKIEDCLFAVVGKIDLEIIDKV
jgi:hypothetical protein